MHVGRDIATAVALSNHLQCTQHGATVVPVSVRQDDIGDGCEVYPEHLGVVQDGIGAGTGVEQEPHSTRLDQRREAPLPDATAVGDSAKWLKEQDICVMTLYNGVPLAVVPPNHVILAVTETDPGVRGDTSGGGGKPAILETGAVVRVPLFINVGDLLKVDTRSGEYVSRAKE